MENHTAAALHTRSCRANQWFAIKANSAGGISSHFLITPSHSQIRGNPAEETSSTDDTQLEELEIHQNRPNEDVKDVKAKEKCFSAEIY